MPIPAATERVNPGTIFRMSTEIVGTPVNESDRQAVADVLSSLAADMGPFRALDFDAFEPATTYDSAEEHS